MEFQADRVPAPAKGLAGAPADADRGACQVSPGARGGEGDAHAPHRRGHGYWALAVGSLGVVFGDIGTSPLYAFQAAMGQAAKDPLAPGAAIGVVSLALWALILVVTVKYVLFVM